MISKLVSSGLLVTVLNAAMAAIFVAPSMSYAAGSQSLNDLRIEQAQLSELQHRLAIVTPAFKSKEHAYTVAKAKCNDDIGCNRMNDLYFIRFAETFIGAAGAYLTSSSIADTKSDIAEGKRMASYCADEIRSNQRYLKELEAMGEQKTAAADWYRERAAELEKNKDTWLHRAEADPLKVRRIGTGLTVGAVAALEVVNQIERSMIQQDSRDLFSNEVHLAVAMRKLNAELTSLQSKVEEKSVLVESLVATRQAIEQSEK